MGTPTKYRPEFPAQLVEHMKLGGSFESFGAVAHVIPWTLYSWLDQYPEWKEAKGLGEAYSLRFHEQIGLKAIVGGIPGFQQATYIFMMKCRFRKFGYNDSSNAPADEDDSPDLSNVPLATLLKIAKK